MVDKTSLDTAALNIFASGGKGFHVEIPLTAFVPKVVKTGYANLPLAYKALATQFAEDSMDWRVYSIGMGRQWRRPNVLRPNGKYKVALSWDQMLELTAQEVDRLTSEPGEIVQPYTGDMNLDLAVMFDKALQDTNERVKAYKKRKPVSPDVFRRPMPSIDLLMEGKGVATTAGYNHLAHAPQFLDAAIDAVVSPREHVEVD